MGKFRGKIGRWELETLEISGISVALLQTEISQIELGGGDCLFFLNLVQILGILGEFFSRLLLGKAVFGQKVMRNW